MFLLVVASTTFRNILADRVNGWATKFFGC